MTVPNLITTIRIILAPVFIIYMIHDDFVLALIVFIICGVSDGLDGLVARIFNQKSTLGTYLDPLADKIVLISAFVALSFRDFLPSWLSVIVLSRDIMIMIGVILLSMNKVELYFKPSILSKLTTCFQFFTIIAVLAKDVFLISADIYLFLFIITALLTISSGLHYIHYWFRLMGEVSAGNNS